MKIGISLEEAQKLLLEQARPVQEEKVPLFNAAGRVLSRDIPAGGNLPSFDKSPLDGYALLAADTEQAAENSPAVLEVIEEVRAGYAPQKKITPGKAVKIMTGTPVSPGADAVIRYEDVQRDGNMIKIFCRLRSDSNIIKAGEDVKKGEIIAREGSLITPPLAGLLAAAGVSEAPVFRQVRVAIVSTGDELLDPSEPLRPAKIYNSNLHALSALCARLGAEPVPLGIVPDEKEAIAAKINLGLEKADIVVITGGVSVGDYDLAPAALDQMGAEKIFWKLDLKPGSPMIAAAKEGKLIAGLSGNPAAAFITFDLIVAPVIKKMMGLKNYLPLKIKVVLADSFGKPSGQRRFLRAKLQLKDGKVYAGLTGKQGNAILKSMLDCNCLIDVPAGSGALTAGQEASALVIGDISFYS